MLYEIRNQSFSVHFDHPPLTFLFNPNIIQIRSVFLFKSNVSRQTESFPKRYVSFSTNPIFRMCKSFSHLFCSNNTRKSRVLSRLKASLVFIFSLYIYQKMKKKKRMRRKRDYILCVIPMFFLKLVDSFIAFAVVVLVKRSCIDFSLIGRVFLCNILCFFTHWRRLPVDNMFRTVFSCVLLLATHTSLVLF